MVAHAGGTPDSGDTAFIIICGALVLMMTLPGLMLFYGAPVAVFALRTRDAREPLLPEPLVPVCAHAHRSATGLLECVTAG